MIDYIIKDGELKLSDKLIYICTGLGTFAGLFPVSYAWLYEFTAAENAELVFKLYTILYFIIPALFGVLWWLLSNRKKKANHILAEKKIRLAVKLNLIIKFVLLSLMLWITNPQIIITIILLTDLILISILIKTIGNNKMRIVLVILSLLYILLTAFINEKGKKITEPLQFDAIFQTNEVYTKLNESHKKLLNISERFLIKSRLAYEMKPEINEIIEVLKKDNTQYLNNDFYNSLSIKPYTHIFSKIILIKDSLEGLTKNASIKENIKLDKCELWFTEDFDEQTINYLKDSSFVHLNSITGYFTKDSFKSNKESKNFLANLFSFIDRIAFDMLETGKQRIHTDDVYKIVKKIQLKEIKEKSKSEVSDSLLHAFSEYKSAEINFTNAIVFYNWLNDLYLPYTQRKTEEESKNLFERVSPIWEAARIKGIFICASIILSIILFWTLYFYDCKTLSDKDENNSQNIKEEFRILTFPLLTLIIIYLGIGLPLLNAIENDKVDLTKPAWFLKLSQWNPSAKFSEDKIRSEKILSEVNVRKININYEIDINKIRFKTDSTLLADTKKIVDKLNSLSDYVKK